MLTENILKTELLENDDVTRYDNHVIFFEHKSKMAADCCIFKFLRRSEYGKHLIRFQSETSVFKFLPRNVDEALVVYHDLSI